MNPINKYSYQFVKSKFEEKGWVLLSETYKNNKQKLKCICPNNHIQEKSFFSFYSMNNECFECYGSKKYTYDYVKNTIESNGYVLLSETYDNIHSKLKMMCDKKHIIEQKFILFVKGHRCNKCSHIGENNPRYNNNLTNEERLLKRDLKENIDWRNQIFKKDNFTCRKCKKRNTNLNAHHIQNYSNYKDKRFDINNGVTLCEKCHKFFHKKYGRKNNNINQLNEFVSSSN
jgi:hypothetical protein